MKTIILIRHKLKLSIIKNKLVILLFAIFLFSCSGTEKTKSLGSDNLERIEIRSINDKIVTDIVNVEKKIYLETSKECMISTIK